MSEPPGGAHRPESGLGPLSSALICGLSFFLSFVVACFAIGRSLPFPEVPGVRSKLDWLAAHGDDFDVLFIGSSRVDQQIIPSVFDRTAASLGCPVRSFNAGIPAMFPPEDGYMLEQILRRPHRRLRWVLLELLPLRGQFEPSVAGTPRMYYWHDARRTWLLTQRAVLDIAKAWQEREKHPLDWRESCGRFVAAWWNHMEAFSARNSNYGRGAELLSVHLLHPRKPSSYDNGGRAGDGWVLREAKPMQGEMLASYERQLIAAREIPRSRTEDPLSEQALRSMIERLRRDGIETMLFLPPTLADTQFHPTRTLASVLFFDFSDIGRHPDLYATGAHRDGVHLNPAGAEIFTRELASLFAERAKAPPP